MEYETGLTERTSSPPLEVRKAKRIKIHHSPEGFLDSTPANVTKRGLPEIAQRFYTDNLENSYVPRLDEELLPPWNKLYHCGQNEPSFVHDPAQPQHGKWRDEGNVGSSEAVICDSPFEELYNRREYAYDISELHPLGPMVNSSEISMQRLTSSEDCARVDGLGSNYQPSANNSHDLSRLFSSTGNPTCSSSNSTSTMSLHSEKHVAYPDTRLCSESRTNHSSTISRADASQEDVGISGCITEIHDAGVQGSNAVADKLVPVFDWSGPGYPQGRSRYH